jgi:hypothetical protein
MSTTTKRMKAKTRHKSYTRAINAFNHENKIWNGRAIVPGSRERVELFGEPTNPALQESARIITQGGRTVTYRNLEKKNYKD